jgi:hypothetical protein
LQKKGYEATIFFARAQHIRSQSSLAKQQAA